MPILWLTTRRCFCTGIYSSKPTYIETNLCQIVTLPYNLLLQKSAREATGIDLKGHVVIIDEATQAVEAVSASRLGI